LCSRRCAHNYRNCPGQKTIQFIIHSVHKCTIITLHISLMIIHSRNNLQTKTLSHCTALCSRRCAHNYRNCPGQKTIQFIIHSVHKCTIITLHISLMKSIVIPRYNSRLRRVKMMSESRDQCIALALGYRRDQVRYIGRYRDLPIRSPAINIFHKSIFTIHHS
jgi:hypothetical protein